MNIGVQQELIGHGEQVRYRCQQQQQNIGYQPQRQQENIVRPVVPPAHDCPRSSSISLFIAIAIIVLWSAFVLLTWNSCTCLSSISTIQPD